MADKTQMLFKTIVASLLATSVAAAPYVAIPTSFQELRASVPMNSRIVLSGLADMIGQLALDVTADVGAMDEDTTKLTELVKAFTGDKAQLTGIQAATQKLETDLKTTTANLVKGKKIGLSDAIAVGTAFQTFVPDSIASIEALTDKKDAFDKAGVTEQIHQSLVRQKSLGDKLNAAIQNKLPSFTKSIAVSQAKSVNDQLDKAIALFAQVGKPPAAANPGPAPPAAAGAAGDAGDAGAPASDS